MSTIILKDLSIIILVMHLTVGLIIGGLILISPKEVSMSSRITATIVGVLLWPFVLKALPKD